MTDRIDVYQRVLNCIPSPHPEKDWRLEHARAAGVIAAAAPLPPSVDLRADWWTVGNQLQTGACVGWATADGLLRWHFVNANALAPDQQLSVRFIWMSAKEADDVTTRPSTFLEEAGTSLKSALDVARKYGAVLDADLPFEPPTLYPGSPDTFYAAASQRRIANYFNLGTNLGAWRQWLAMTGPVIVRLDVDATWDNASSTGGLLDTYRPDTTRGGHAVAIVGYTLDDRFIVRNSWGTGWGSAGFGFASEAYAQAAFTESYGITV